MKNIIRLLIVPWYLLGWLVHLYLGFSNPGLYGSFGQTALLPGFAGFWNSFIMPRITSFTLLLAGFEVMVGFLLISAGKRVKIGLAFSIAFNLFLIQLGLSYPAPDGLSDFLVNRMPNLVFIMVQIPLFWGEWKNSLFTDIQGWMGLSSKD